MPQWCSVPKALERKWERHRVSSQVGSGSAGSWRVDFLRKNTIVEVVEMKPRTKELGQDGECDEKVVATRRGSDVGTFASVSTRLRLCGDASASGAGSPCCALSCQC